MTNFPGPEEIRLFYSATQGGIVYPHVHRFSVDVAGDVDPGEAMSEYPLNLKGGTTQAADAFIDDYVDLIADLYRTDTDFIYAELWRYVPDTFDSFFLSAHTVGQVGANAGATIADQQSIITFRSANGGGARLDFRHTVGSEQVTRSFPTPNTTINNLAAFVTGSLSPIKARDNGFLIAPIHWLSGLNEHLSKKRLRGV
jgi:hypothetical protein